MARIKGPYTIKWGDNTLTDIEEIDFSHEIDSTDYDTVQGSRIEVDGVYKATAILTLIGADRPALAAVLPQHFVANGATLSTGETVNDANGAIDIVPGSCDESTVYNNLDIIACGTDALICRINNARTKVEGIEFDGPKLMKVMVKFVGEPAQDEATVQFFEQNTISTVS